MDTTLSNLLFGGVVSLIDISPNEEWNFPNDFIQILNFSIKTLAVEPTFDVHVHLTNIVN